MCVYITDLQVLQVHIFHGVTKYVIGQERDVVQENELRVYQALNMLPEH
jgi:hypothetical protein